MFIYPNFQLLNLTSGLTVGTNSLHLKYLLFSFLSLYGVILRLSYSGGSTGGCLLGRAAPLWRWLGRVASTGTRPTPPGSTPPPPSQQTSPPPAGRRSSQNSPGSQNSRTHSWTASLQPPPSSLLCSVCTDLWPGDWAGADWDRVPGHGRRRPLSVLRCGHHSSPATLQPRNTDHLLSYVSRRTLFWEFCHQTDGLDKCSIITYQALDIDWASQWCFLWSSSRVSWWITLQFQFHLVYVELNSRHEYYQIKTFSSSSKYS